MKLDGLRLPGKEHPKEALPALYEQLLRDHGIRTKAQISQLDSCIKPEEMHPDTKLKNG